MHQSLFQEITSTSAIRNTSLRKERKEKEKTLWLQRFQIKRRHSEDDGEFPGGTKEPTKCDRKKSHCVRSLFRILAHINTEQQQQQQDIISLNTVNSYTKWFSPSVKFNIFWHWFMSKVSVLHPKTMFLSIVNPAFFTWIICFMPVLSFRAVVGAWLYFLVCYFHLWIRGIVCSAVEEYSWYACVSLCV